jgi:hypothetical protein
MTGYLEDKGLLLLYGQSKRSTAGRLTKKHQAQLQAELDELNADQRLRLQKMERTLRADLSRDATQAIKLTAQIDYALRDLLMREPGRLRTIVIARLVEGYALKLLGQLRVAGIISGEFDERRDIATSRRDLTAAVGSYAKAHEYMDEAMAKRFIRGGADLFAEERRETRGLLDQVIEFERDRLRELEQALGSEQHQKFFRIVQWFIKR